MPREKNPRRRPREACEHHPGNECEAHHPCEDLYRCDHVCKGCPRMHVAVPDRRKCFDTEEEIAPVSVRIEVCNTCWLECVDSRKQQIEQKEEEAVAREEARPADHHEVMVEIMPGPVWQAEPEESATCEGHHMWKWPSHEHAAGPSDVRKVQNAGSTSA